MQMIISQTRKRGSDLIATHKVCRTCNETRPIDEFWFQDRKRGRRQRECRFCMKERTARWHETHPEVIKKANAASVRKRRAVKPQNILLIGARYRARSKGLECTITLADIVIPEFCPVLGIRLEWHTDRGRRPSISEKDTSPSIDRIDNTKGYVPGNIAIVSFRANRLKSDASLAELSLLSEYYGSRDGHKIDR